MYKKMFNFFGNKEKVLEKEKNKLMHDLENGGIRQLVLKMGSNEFYSILIKEKHEKEGSFASDDYISHYAYKVSSGLNNTIYKTELLELLADASYSPYKKYIFCCLASLCSNTTDYQLFDFLLKHISGEDDEEIIVSILSRLDEIVKPASVDISVIKKNLIEGNQHTRRAAIKALCNCRHSEVEDLLLDEFKVSDKHTKSSICGPLQSVGTTKSIPVLKSAYKATRDPWLRHNIEYTLNAISERGSVTD